MRLIGGNISDTPVKEIGDGSAFNVGGSSAPISPVHDNYGTPERAFDQLIDESGFRSTTSFNYFPIKDGYYGVVYRDNASGAHVPRFSLVTFSGDTPTFQTAVDLSAKHIYVAGACQIRAVSMDNDTDLVTYSVSAPTSGHHEVCRWTINLATGALSFVSKTTQNLVGAQAPDTQMCGIEKIATDNVIISEGYAADIRYTGLKISSSNWGTPLTPTAAASQISDVTGHPMHRNGTNNEVLTLASASNYNSVYINLISINTSNQALTEVDHLQIATASNVTATLGGGKHIFNVAQDKLVAFGVNQILLIDATGSGSSSLSLAGFMRMSPPHVRVIYAVSPNSAIWHMGNGRFYYCGSYYNTGTIHVGLVIDPDNWGTIAIDGGGLYGSRAYGQPILPPEGGGTASNEMYVHAIIGSSESAGEVTVLHRSGNIDGGKERMYTVDLT